jgi:hypothetical protein
MKDAKDSEEEIANIETDFSTCFFFTDFDQFSKSIFFISFVLFHHDIGKSKKKKVKMSHTT